MNCIGVFHRYACIDNTILINLGKLVNSIAHMYLNWILSLFVFCPARIN